MPYTGIDFTKLYFGQKVFGFLCIQNLQKKIYLTLMDTILRINGLKRNEFNIYKFRLKLIHKFEYRYHKLL
jgi:hypothetical protein